MKDLFPCAVLTTTLLGTTALATPQLDQQLDEIDPSIRINAEQARQVFSATHPQSSFNIRHDHITRVYGKAFAHGNSPLDAATNFLSEHANMFGIHSDELLPIGPNGDGTHVLPVGYDKLTGTSRFSLVGYKQTVDGIPVFRGDIRILVRDEPTFPVVLVSNALIDMSEYDGRFQGLAATPTQLNERVFLRHAANQFFHDPIIGGVEQVIWAGYDGAWAEPRLAVSFVATGGANFQPETYQKYLYVVDAKTGRILYQENMILDFDFDVSVTARVTQGDGSDDCFSETPEPMPYARVVVGGDTYFADEDGKVIIPGSGNQEVTSDVSGLYFTVNDDFDNSVGSITAELTSGQPYTFEHNALNQTEYDRAEVNAYTWSNRTRDWALRHFPDMPTISTQEFFTININLSNSCNAFYDGSSINFYTSGNGCPNTAFSDVVAHEYGHHMINVCGSGQGQYGEGGSDCNGVLLTREPTLGNGFLGNCSGGIRNADNNLQYPCSGAIHECGQLLSGCVWDLITNLGGAESDAAIDTVSYLWVNSICVHTGTEITPDITIDFMTFDDDDLNIFNGTPNYFQIQNAFSLHNMPGPELALIEIAIPSGAPQIIAPEGEDFTVRISDVTGTYAPGTGKLNYRIGNSGPFTTVDLAPTADDLFVASLPSAACDESFEFFITAETTSGLEVSLPSNAPGIVFAAPVATGFETIVSFDFETNPGWTSSGVSGANVGEWQVGAPCGTTSRGAPGSDFDGSGQCYLTGLGACDSNTDIDNGCAVLTTSVFPTINANGNDANITYALWYDNTGGGIGAEPSSDILEVDISTDGGATWTNVETVGPLDSRSSGGWFAVTFQVSTYATPSEECLMRFTACDFVDEGSVIEAAVDMFSVEIILCEEDGCPGADNSGDTNGDGIVDGADVTNLLANWGLPYPAGDFDCNGVIDGADLTVCFGFWTF